MHEKLTTEAVHPASADLDRLSTLDLVRLINAEDATVAAAVGAQSEAIARAIDLVAVRLADGGRLVYIGAGTSGRLGVLDASECPPTFNADPGQVIGLIAGGDDALRHAVEGAEDSREAAVEDLRRISLSAYDVLVGITASGAAPYVITALDAAREVGAATIALTCNADSQAEAHADLTIAVVVGPEVLSGSTRMKAGTATKLVLNTLTTGAMVRLGKTYGNLMVDLQASNAKLVGRSRRILQHLSDLDETAADRLLAACDGELKTAILVAQLGIDIEEARQRLAGADGRLRVALDDDA